MIKRYRPAIAVSAFAGAVFLSWMYLRNRDIAVLNPKGPIAHQQMDLMITALLLMMIVVLPVFFMMFLFAWKYRAGNKKAKYTPDWDGHRIAEIAWWTIPGIIITILGFMIWRSSHDLDPYRALSSDKKPITVQVVALQWKWLFIYPEYGIASVNYLQFPEDTPLNFEITADAPMNSFWIPQLGGQVYAMAGMTTKLHLMADEPGSYAGSSANLSGEGFSNMTFTAKAGSRAEFDAWVKSLRASQKVLDMAEYAKLAKPSLDSAVISYSSTEPGLHSKVIDKYMKPVAEEGGEDRDNKAVGTDHHY